ncbi:MAG: ATP-binding cassette domain-containing protein, partial [Pseudolabrys sp.]
MTALLVLDNVSAGYVADIDILRGVSIKVAPGVITGLIGLNGAGKSTILKTICGILRPSSGLIMFDGADITGIAPHTVIDHDIFYIPQESSLFNFMTVEDNLR